MLTPFLETCHLRIGEEVRRRFSEADEAEGGRFDRIKPMPGIVGPGILHSMTRIRVIVYSSFVLGKDLFRRYFRLGFLLCTARVVTV